MIQQQQLQQQLRAGAAAAPVSAALQPVVARPPAQTALAAITGQKRPSSFPDAAGTAPAEMAGTTAQSLAAAASAIAPPRSDSPSAGRIAGLLPQLKVQVETLEDKELELSL